MAPTTIIGQKTTTSPYGRTPKREGYPVRVAEMLATLDGAVYIARVAVHKPKYIIAAKKALRKAFETQMRGLGFSLVEFLSQCPTNWGMPPQESVEWVERKMLPYYPLGEFKTPEAKQPLKDA